MKGDASKVGTTDRKINVCIRVRPPRNASSATCVDSDASTGALTFGIASKTKTFRFASVVEGSDQASAYGEIARPLLERLRRGRSCALCAYGQTGSGKTHSVFGPPGSLTVTSVARANGAIPAEWGIFPRLALELLRVDCTAAIHASAIEIYQESAYDLLADRAPLTVGTKRAGLKVGGGAVTVHGNDRASNHCGTHPPGCSCRKCFEALEKMKAMRAAARNNDSGGTPCRRKESKRRQEFATVGETLQKLETAEDVARFALLVEGTRTSAGHNLNERSSRSHCLIAVHVSRRSSSSGGGGNAVRRGKLLLADLAGSERIAKSGVEGVARHQAASINGSLTVLGKVVRALASRQRHVPYRDSALTMLLRNSLDDPTSSMVFLINVAPDADHAEETTCSLEFGKRLEKVPSKKRTATAGRDEESEDVAAATDELELERLLDQLHIARTKLSRAEARGQGERFDPTAPEGEVRLLQRNLRRLREEEGKVRAVRFELAEVRASCKGDGGGEGGGGDCGLDRVAAAEARLRAREKEHANYRDIVARQQSIRGLYRPAKEVYKACEREVRHLEARIRMLRELK